MLTSFPSGIPLPKVAVNPITFATSVLNVKYSFSATPLNIVFISGIPEPGINNNIGTVIKQEIIKKKTY